MKFDKLVVLLPCQSLEDFPLQRSPAESEQLLSAWSALWHPALLDAARTMPSWYPAEDPPREPAGYLVIVPDCSLELIADDWLQQAVAGGACVIRDFRHREDLLCAALAHLDEGPTDLDAELVADFLALGFCHFQVELLTRQLRYMSNLDEESFLTEVLAAVDETLRGDGEAARQRLQASFDLLHDSREYFYPVEAHLLDLTLVAQSTIGRSLRDKLSGGMSTNLLVCADVIEQMARQEPDTLKALAEALENNTAAIVGGELAESALPLLTPEAIRYRLRRGLAKYEELLGVRPTVFGRRRFGLTPVLPQILHKLGFSAAIHCTLDDGRFPVGSQSRIQWEGLDGTSLDALARVPFDISRSDTFLRLPERLGDAMDLDHVATAILAHWPGQSSTWYRDLERIGGYSPVVGTFATITDYFSDTNMAGQTVQHPADKYRSPYLVQEVVGGGSDPISRWVRYYGRRAAAEATQALGTLATLLSDRPTEAAGRPVATDNLLAAVEESLDQTDATDDELDRRLEDRLHDTLAGFFRLLGGDDRQAEAGYLVANPHSFSRRMCLDMPELPRPPAADGGVRAADERSVVLDVPAMGFAWVGPGPASPEPPRPAKTGGWLRRKAKKDSKEELPLAELREEEDIVLRNEFFTASVDRHTGALQSISDYYTRGARLAQQLALRTPRRGSDDPGGDANYSVMTTDEVTVTSAGPALGEVVCRGRLVDRDVRRLAGFTQTTRIRRGSRVIELQIELDIAKQPEPDPWQSYYAARFAWGDATSSLYRSVNMANLPTDVVQLEAPHFVDIRSGKVRSTILTGGLPYHRRFGLRRLDTLLVVHGETARRFRIGIGIDLPAPMPAAMDFIAPPTTLSSAGRPTNASGWLFHLDVRNVVATHWEPLLEAGRGEGFCVRLLETDGRNVQLGLRSFRAIRSAHKLQPGTAEPRELAVEGDRIAVDLGPHEWAEVEARFTD